MPGTRETFAAPARPESLDLLHEALGRFWTEVETTRKETVPASVRYKLMTAVSEVANNIIIHAHADTLNFSLCLRGEVVEVRLEDRGIPYEGTLCWDGQGALRDEFEVPKDPEEVPERGRGLLLACRALHAFDYERLPEGVNRWRLVARLLEHP